MVRSLAVILLPLLVITFIFTRDPGGSPITVVDWRPAYQQASNQAPYDVLVPQNLPEQWRPTHVSWTRQGQPEVNGQPSASNDWQLGFLSPDDIYIVIEQSDGPAKAVVADVTREGARDGESLVGGTTWQRWVSPDHRTRSLVWPQEKVTSIVVGDTGYPALEAFASTLDK